MVIMPKADWQAALDATRAKTGKGEPIKSGELAAEIEGITGGGGKPFDCRSVTFMHDGAELYVRSVGDGDTCADPVARGLVAAPTKESTAQYDYPHAGWSLTDGGSASSSALANVTADRTVYAAFQETTRYYTISFYDGETLLTTKQVAYGGTATYTPPAKDGYFFGSWNPAPENVTSDMDCYAQWSEIVVFATASWADIANISEKGEARKHFAIGDTRDIPITYDGKQQTLTFKIVGFDHDDLSDGTGKAGITLALTKTVDATATWNGTSSAKLLYDDSNLHLNAERFIYDALPTELKNVVKSVKKTVDSAYSSGAAATKTIWRKYWAFSTTELGGVLGSTITQSQASQTNYMTALGTAYEAFASNTDKNKMPPVVNQSNTTVTYLTRTLWRCGAIVPMVVEYANGSVKIPALSYSTKTATNPYYVCIGICI